MAEYSFKTIREYFERRAMDPRLAAEPMVLSGYGLPEDGAAWWTEEQVRKALFADVTRKLYAGTPPDRLRVLELGCAGGNLLRHLAGAPRRLVGADLSFHMLAVARDMKLPGVSLVQADGLTLPFRDRSFDRVLCYSVVTNFPDEATVERLIAEMLRILEPGGRALIGNTPDQRKEHEVHALVSRLQGQRAAAGLRAGRLGQALGWGRAVLNRALHGPQPGVRNRTFHPDFFVEAARRHGAEANILPLDVPGYVYAEFRFDVELVRA